MIFLNYIQLPENFSSLLSTIKYLYCGQKEFFFDKNFYNFYYYYFCTIILLIISARGYVKVIVMQAVAVTFRHLCLPVFAWRRAVLHIFDPKQLLRVSCIVWCYYLKHYSTIVENASLWRIIVIFLYVTRKL